ncbi:hypothetical protein CVT24_001839 [Panaeolus cyanescens]|uniref:Uncharacterized protein n=1 Tax=Panaeolus cyanescens TaxID=181874 RepID=A0A409YET8_9AGAR|nr:hypothetical protein CVT24_001839 [Panaeolus cyanescens]
MAIVPPVSIDVVLKDVDLLVMGKAVEEIVTQGHRTASQFKHQIFNQYFEAYGSDMLLQVESVNTFWKTQHVENISLQVLSSSIIKKLEESKTATEAFGLMFLKLWEWLRSILLDENAYFGDVVEETGLWFERAKEKWTALENKIRVTNENLMAGIRMYPALFTFEDSYAAWGCLTDDESLREAQIEALKPRVKTRPAVRKRYTCTLTLQNVEKLQSHRSRVSIELEIRAWVKPSPYGITLQCEAQLPSDSPDVRAGVKIVDHAPKTQKEITDNIDVEPLGCTPYVHTRSTSPAHISWKISRKNWFQKRPTTGVPTRLPLSIVVEHTTDFTLYVRLDIVRYEWFFKKFSGDTEINIEAVLQDVDFFVIGTATSELVKDIGPLVSRNAEKLTGVKSDYVEELRKQFQHFTGAVDYNFLALSLASSAISSLGMVLDNWEAWNIEFIVQKLVYTVDELLRVHQYTLSAMTAYAEAISGLDTLFRKYLEANGSDVLLQFETTNTFWNTHHLENISPHALSSSIIKKLQDSKVATEAFGLVFLKLSEWLRGVLLDENDYFGDAVQDTNLWFDHARQKWGALEGKILSTNGHLMKGIDMYPAFFTFKDIHAAWDRLMSDQSSRTIQIEALKPRVKTRLAVRKHYSPIPCLLTRKTVCSYSCKLTLQNVEKIEPHRSRIFIDMEIEAWVKPPPHIIHLQCEVQTPPDSVEKGASIKITDHSPKTRKEISQDVRVEPARCTPSIHIHTQSPAILTWRVSRQHRFLNRASTGVPTLLPLSLVVEHTTDFLLCLRLSVTRYEWLFKNFSGNTEVAASFRA